MREAYMKCQVSPGVFSSEYSVVIPMSEDEYAYSWVDNSNVIVTSGEVKWEGKDVEAARGWVRVVVMEERPGSTLVTLPYDSFSRYRSFWVNPEMVEYNPA